MAYHVLVPDNVNPRAIEIIEISDDVTVHAPGRNMPREEVLEHIDEANALIVRSSTTVDAELLDAAPNLSAIARAGVGVDNIDLEAATAHNVVVMNTPQGNTIATAEHAFGLMLSLARHIPQAHLSMNEGRWDRKKYMGTELRGKTLGIVGFGRIGQALARRAGAFGMSMIAFDVIDMARTAAQHNVELVGLDELYARSDFITLHPVLNDDTRGMVDAEALGKMKEGCYLINAARGALIVEEDLVEALREGHIGGAALDVYINEPPRNDNPLIGMPNVIHTPHLAASTHEAQVAVAVDAANQVLDALLLGEYRNVVNPKVLEKNTT